MLKQYLNLVDAISGKKSILAKPVMRPFFLNPITYIIISHRIMYSRLYKPYYTSRDPVNKINIMLMNNVKIVKFTPLHFLHTIVGGFGMNSSSIKKYF